MADSKRKGRIPDEAKLGFAFLLAIIIFVYGLFFLKEIRVTGGTYMIRAEFANISGVKRSDPVQIDGVQIGKVDRIGLDNQGPFAVLRIDEAFRIPEDSSIEVMARSVMGEMALDIHKGNSTMMVPPNGLLKGHTAIGLNSILTSADSLSTSLQTLIANASNVLDPESGSSIKQSLRNIRELTGALKTALSQERRQIHGLMANMDSLVTNIQDISTGERGKISTTLSNMEQASAQLTDMSARLQRSTHSLENILQRMEQGEGTLGKLLKDDKLYTDMDKLMVNMDGLITDLKENPKRYLNVSIF